MSLDSQYFEREIEAAERVISQMQIDLKAYAERDNASQSIIDEKYKVIAAFIQLAEAARTFAQAHTDALRYEFDRGRVKGRREAEIEYVLPARFYEHPETLRDISKQRARETQPELFITDYQTKLFNEQI
jgi:hypothetical protein